MHSELLAKHGLTHFITGSDYNFRYQTVGGNIKKELERALAHHHLSINQLYTGHQSHSANVHYADGINGEPFVIGKTFRDTDGLMTDKKGVALLVKFADCTPLLIFDPVKKVQASVHSGWRGTVQQISLSAIQKMEDKFGSKREDLLIYVGPSIGQAHYQVGKEVYDAFESFTDRDSFFKEDGEKFRLSMTDANLSILKRAGIRDEQLDVCRESTFSSDQLHSARREGKAYQLNAMISVLN